MKQNLATLANFGGDLAEMLAEMLAEIWRNCTLASEFGLIWLILA